jgi:predicted dinucleotide-binding enzyme
MAFKETIAFVELAVEKFPKLINQLAEQNFSLLLVTEDSSQLHALSEEIKSNFPHTNVETVNCVREGCWEADIIIVAETCNAEKELTAKMKEVATQKIVLYIASSKENALENIENIQSFLPHSKIVWAFENEVEDKITIGSGDQEAIAVLSAILNKVV